MLRLLIKLIGLLLLAAAFAALVVDGTRSVAAGSISLQPLGTTFATLAPNLFQKTHETLAAKAPGLWDPLLVTLFLLPTWVVSGALGLALLALSRRPARKIGYSRR